MEPQVHPPEMSDDDALSLWVGRVARVHAHLEYDVDNVRRFLSRHVGRPPDSKSLMGVDQLISECRRLLKRSDAGQEVLTSGDTALLAAREATGMRNRVLHDMWLSDPLRGNWESARWNSFRRAGDLQLSYATANLQDLATVVDTHTYLVRTRVRVSGLFMALHATWPTCARAEEPPGRDSMPGYVALMTDRFTLRTNGDVEVV